jgi:hypothetical protein
LSSGKRIAPPQALSKLVASSPVKLLRDKRQVVGELTSNFNAPRPLRRILLAWLAFVSVGVIWHVLALATISPQFTSFERDNFFNEISYWIRIQS